MIVGLCTTWQPISASDMICILPPILENPSFPVALIWYLICQPLCLLSFLNWKSGFLCGQKGFNCIFRLQKRIITIIGRIL